MANIGTDVETIAIGELLPKVIEKKSAGWRLIQICSVWLKDSETYELSYSFAYEYEMVNFRLVIRKDDEIPSITQIYRAAFLYENEMSELFGVKIKMIAQDYQGKLYRINEVTPFKTESNKPKEEK